MAQLRRLSGRKPPASVSGDQRFHASDTSIRTLEYEREPTSERVPLLFLEPVFMVPLRCKNGNLSVGSSRILRARNSAKTPPILIRLQSNQKVRTRESAKTRGVSLSVSASALVSF